MSELKFFDTGRVSIEIAPAILKAISSRTHPLNTLKFLLSKMHELSALDTRYGIFDELEFYCSGTLDKERYYSSYFALVLNENSGAELFLLCRQKPSYNHIKQHPVFLFF